MLFSATMTDKVAKLQGACLRNPVKVQVSEKYSTVEGLKQYYMLLPLARKDIYLAYLINSLTGSSVIIFASTCNSSQRIALMLRNLGFGAVALHGQMSQPKRLGALASFTSGNRTILVATDVASRGLDLPRVDCVLNYDLPTNSKTYIHRVGRTARAGRTGKAITFVTQYDADIYQKLEGILKVKMPEYEADKEEAMFLAERVAEAQRFATMELKEADAIKKGKQSRGDGMKRRGGGFSGSGKRGRRK